MEKFSNTSRLSLLCCMVIFCVAFKAGAQQQKGWAIVPRPEQKQVDILYNGKLMTAYCYYDSIRKPFLFPINTVDGVTVTRGYPLQPRTGDRTDHPHHTGLWMNYESVNGLDFWNNSTAIAPERRSLYGTIRHDRLLIQKATRDQATLVVAANWHRPDGKVLLRESTTFLFRIQGNQFLIDRIATLTAQDTTVFFKDVKDGFLAIRVARELEMPSREKSDFVDAQGNITTVPALGNEQVSGMYYNSEGASGDSVWGTKGRWAMLQGRKDGRRITVGIFDHPANPGYPAYWHARGYGLFSLNPLGRKVFSNGKEELNFIMKPGETSRFHYRILIASGEFVDAREMNKMSDAFIK